MTIIARRIASTPVRTSGETWETMINLISDDSSTAREELESISGIVASIIADEVPKNTPITVVGSGPRIRMYCLYNEDAIIGDDKNENSLATNPTAEDWKIYLPCLPEDLEWIKNEIKKFTDKVIIYDKDKKPEDVQDDRKAAKNKLTINTNRFLDK
jgi:hypothetical protein